MKKLITVFPLLRKVSDVDEIIFNFNDIMFEFRMKWTTEKRERYRTIQLI